MAKSNDKGNPPAEGTKRRKRGTGGALFQVFGVIGRKLAGKTDGWDDGSTPGQTRH